MIQAAVKSHGELAEVVEAQDQTCHPEQLIVNICIGAQHQVVGL